MKLTLTSKDMLSSVMALITEAQAYLATLNINQWQNGYPNEEIILNDIEKGESYVLIKESQIIATVVISFNKEDTYKNIDGKWLTNNPYAVVHRLAIKNTLKGIGLGRDIFSLIEDICREKQISSIKVDTHCQNIAMQKNLEKLGYTYCGVILLKDRTERWAFEKILF